MRAAPAALTPGRAVAGYVVVAAWAGARSWPVACPWRRLTGRACPVCGLTRSVALAWRGRWRESFAAHRLGVPLVVAVAARMLVRPVPGSRAGSRPRSRAA
ncbi:DUF2752 domain-containing protein [Pseudonocardia dioxanivorans]|uniref:DUF2752 domain-containing protein n=1 Tax=Pseudonocardia sp. D17 TaxID=882661 RepID=UPI00131A540D|nr:hypothetical protein PSD17_61980 [Pseudonocardia sp. D17]